MKKRENELVSNRKAFYNFEILDTVEAGIVLLGTEIKSLRNHGGSLQDSYIIISKQKPIMKNSSIAPYKFGNIHNHEDRRDRTLLLHKSEIEKLARLIQQKGVSLIPLSIYLKNGFAKIKIGIAKGKKSYDKRAALKKKEDKKSIADALKE